MKTSFMKRMLALLLVVCMVIPMAPALTLHAKAAETTQATTTQDGPVLVIAGSDFQANTTVNGAANVNGILTQIQGAYPDHSPYGFLFAGDYTNSLSYDEANYNSSLQGLEALQNAVSAVYPGLGTSDTAVYVQGNHDPTECINNGYLSPSGDNDTDHYGVFVMHEDDFQWSNLSTPESVKPTANALRSYLNAKLANGYTKPIFVVSHVPLHYTMRTLQNGDSRYANHIFSVLNEAAGAGLNIIFLYGHNHSASWEDSHGGTSVFYTKGDQINICYGDVTECKAETLNFTYMNAGYVGYYTAKNDGVDTTLNMSVFEITGNQVTISRYDAAGIHTLKSAGVPNTGYTTYTESNYYQPNTTVVASPKVIQLNKSVNTNHVIGGGMEPVTAEGTVHNYPVLATSLVAGTYYYIQGAAVDWMLSGEATTHTDSSGTEKQALVLEDVRIHEGDRWLYAQATRDTSFFTLSNEGSADGYITLTGGEAYLINYAGNDSGYTRNHFIISLNDDGKTFTVKRENKNDYLHQPGNETTPYATSYSQGGNANIRSAWRFYSLGNAAATLSVAPSLYTVTTAQTVTMTPELEVDGREISDFTITWSSSDPGMATVDANGFVQPLEPGRVTITATLTSVDGIALAEPISAEIPLNIFYMSTGEPPVSASGFYTNMTQSTTLEPGVPSGPYVIETNVANTSYKYLSGNVTTSVSNANLNGLELVTTNDYSHLWYYDGTYLRYNSLDGPYLTLDDDVSVTLSDNPVHPFDNLVKNGSVYKIGNTHYGKYLNQYGGKGSNVVFVYGSGNWIFHEVKFDNRVTLRINPGSASVTVGGQETLIFALLGNGVRLTDCSLNWSVDDTSVATVDSNGVVTGVSQGNTTVRCTLTRVAGYSSPTPLTLSIPVAVTAKEQTESTVTAIGQLERGTYITTTLTQGTPSGPYAIINPSNGRVVSGIEGYTSSTCTGLEVVEKNDYSHLWYYDGQYFRYGSWNGEYLAVVNGEVCLSPDVADAFDNVFPHQSYPDGYMIQNTKAGTYQYLNQLGGGTNYAAGLWGGDATSRWNLNLIVSYPVALSVTPSSYSMGSGSKVLLTPKVAVNGAYTSNYSITWTSSDPSVATVSNGTVTTLSGGRAVITATLTKANGYGADIRVDVPINVVEKEVEDTTITLSTTLGPRPVPLTTAPTGAGGPYLIYNNSSGYILTGVQAVSSRNADGTYCTTGAWLKPREMGTFSDLWYYDGTGLLYGDPNATDRYLTFENDMVGLGTADSILFDTLSLSTKTITASGITANDKNLNQYGLETNEAAHVFYMAGNSNGGSSFSINQIVAESNIELSVRPEDGSFDLLITDTKKLIPTLKLNDATHNKYTVSYSSSDSTKALVNTDGTIHPKAPGNVTIYVQLTSVDGGTISDEIVIPVYIRVCAATSASINIKEGSLPLNASDRVTVKAAPEQTEVPMLTVTFDNDAQRTIPLIGEYITDAQGNNIDTGDPDVIENLTVSYWGVVACTDFTLHILGSNLPDYPDYPAEGSVYVDKTATDVNYHFQSSGLAQVELSASGVPVKKGADVIIMLDTSSSMGDAQMNALCTSLNNMLNGFQGKAQDGSNLDIRVAVADFNGFYYDPFSNYYLNADDHPAGTSIRPNTNSSARVYTGSKTLTADAFVNVRELGMNPFTGRGHTGDKGENCTSLHTGSGTNYDYAFDAVYQLGEAIGIYNSDNGEERDLYVIFMSDGAPFQYNYFGTQSTSTYWNNYLTGTMTDEMFADTANKDYYNEDGKHWMAEAIKGNRRQEYPVIRKNDYRDLDGDNFINVKGLGATLYAIGFCLEVDNEISVEAMEYVIEGLATNSEYSFFADDATELGAAFTKISNDIMYAASNAYMIDTMGSHYDLQMGDHIYKVGDVDTTFSDVRIEARTYMIYTQADYEDGLCTEAQIGVRKQDAEGNLIYTVDEVVTFNAAGTQAYSNKIHNTAADGTVTYPNILVDGVISAYYFRYNSNSTARDVTLDDGSTYNLAAETFYWEVGTISTNQKALNYYVYLNDAVEGNRTAGAYPTNESAVLYYENYLRHDCSITAPVPTMTWMQAQVGYGFYLVDKSGKPIVNKDTGLTGSFENSIKYVHLSEPVYREFLTNSSVTLIASRLLPKELAETYRLFDPAAQYDVTLNGDGSGSILIFTDGVVPVSTYVTGLETVPIVRGDENGSPMGTENFKTANTVVWFAVTLADDAVNVDKTVEAVEGTDDEFTLTLDAFASGGTSMVSTVKPADIVLVLDQSASMYAPAGLNADAYYADKDDARNTAIPSSARVDDFVSKVQAGDEATLENAKHLGYYIARHNTYDYLYIVQYAQNKAGKWGWYYVPVDVTSTAVEVDTENTTINTDVALFTETVGIWDSTGNPIYTVNGERNPKLRDKFLTYSQSNHSILTNVTYYKSQYAALYDSVNEFVSDLYQEAVANEVDHRISIVGFASPYYDGYENYDGTGLYIDGEYYLYDSEYRYMGYRNTNSTYGYTLYVTGEKYERMKGILPDNLKGNTWTDTLPSGITEADLVPIDPNTAGDYFIPNATATLPNTVGDEQYASALMSVVGSNGALNTNVTASIEAITTNYLQTCPAIGLRIARSIFRGTEIELADPGLANSNTTAEDLINAADPTGIAPKDRDQIIVLFTDGTPTVSMYSNQEDGKTKNAEIRNEYWTGNGGVRDTINEANAAKQEGIDVYTIGTAAASKAYGNRGEAAEVQTKVEFLDLVSSNYPDSNSVYDVVTPAGDNTTVAANGYNLYVNYGTQTADRYALSVADGMNLDAVFENIMVSIAVPMVQLEGNTVLKEVLTDYFDLINQESGSLQSNISVYTADYLGVDEDGNHLFSETLVPFNADVEILQSEDGQYDTITVKNFNYSTEYIGIYNGSPRGRKLVVKVDVKVRDGFWGGNNVPTNETATGIYTGDGEKFVEFPVPEVNVAPGMRPVVVPVDRVAYYEEPTLNNLADLTESVTVDGINVNIDASGNLTPQAPWMDDYADLVWNRDLDDPTNTAVSNLKGDEYTFGVILVPKSGMTGESNTTGESNIVGTPISTTGIVSDTVTATVDILVPLVTLQDSIAWIGELITRDYLVANNTAGDVRWINESDPYGTEGKPTVANMGAVPAVRIGYRAPDDAGERFTEETPFDAYVYLRGNTKDNVADECYFDWVPCTENHNSDQVVVDTVAGDAYHRHKGNVDSYEFYVHINRGLNADTVVIDFGLPVEIDVLGNDEMPAAGTLTGAKFDALTTYFAESADAEIAKQTTSDHGSVSVEDGKLCYTPTDMEMGTEEIFVYEVSIGSLNWYYYSTVTVIPATTIYYEDNLAPVKFHEDADSVESLATWTPVGTSVGGKQDQDRPGVGAAELDANRVYGYDSAYHLSTSFSNGSAYQVTVTRDRNTLATTNARASFTFTGTGFDIISYCSAQTGIVMATVYRGDNIDFDNIINDPVEWEAKYVASYMVDTYYGYTGGGNEEPGTPDTDSTGILYQVPVIKADLTRVMTQMDDPNTPDVDESVYEDYGYGTYTVELYIAPSFLEREVGYWSADFYLDAIRIYNPAGIGYDNSTAGQVVQDAYQADGEAWPEYYELRNLILNRNSLSHENVNGVVFIDGQDDPTVADYKSWGPNNEVYLNPGQSIAFTVDSSIYSTDVDGLYLGVRGLTGEGRFVATVKSTTIAAMKVGTTDMYYDISYRDNSGKLLIGGKVVVISNPDKVKDANGNEVTNTAPIAITNLRVVYKEKPAVANTFSTRIVSNNDTVTAAYEILTAGDLAVDPIITPEHPALSFNGTISYNVFYSAENLGDLTGADLGLAVFSTEDPEGTVETAREVIYGAEEIDGLYMTSTSGVNAKYLGDTQYFRVFAKKADGTFVYSKMVSYSAVDYATNVLAKSEDVKLKQLVIAMLNYGAAAQQFFGYKTDDLMNACLTADDLALLAGFDANSLNSAIKVDASKVGAFGSTGGFSKKSPAISFNGAFEINYFFTPSNAVDGSMKLYFWSEDTYNSVTELTADNADKVVEMTEESGTYTAASDEIAAKYLDKTVFVAAVYESNGTTYCSGVLPYSIAAYCQKPPAGVEALATAAAIYGCTAKQYFAV